jgi:hypothetical protein
MSDEVATGLQRIPIAHLPAIAGSASDWLMPRWPQHPIFWSALLRHSRDPLGVRLLAIKSLGRQLLAAESLEVQNLPKVADKRLLSSNLSVRSTVNTNKAGLGGQSHEPINGNRQRARQSR